MYMVLQSRCNTNKAKTILMSRSSWTVVMLCDSSLSNYVSVWEVIFVHFPALHMYILQGEDPSLACPSPHENYYAMADLHHRIT